jgi:outer membrane cobalamin receptor
VKKFFFCFLGLVFLSQASSRSEELKTFELNPIVVTATRFPEQLKNIPAHTSVIDKKEIASFNFTCLSEVLKTLAGVDIKSSGAFGQAASLSLRGSSSSQVLFLLDGRPLNSLTYGSFNLPDFPLEQVERIEIVRGSLSSLYGANALSGVVNIITTSPSAKLVTGSLSYGTFKTSDIYLKLSPVYKNLRTTFGLQKKDTDNQRKNSDYSDLSVYGKTVYQFSSKFQMESFFKLNQDDLGVPGPVPPLGSIPIYGGENSSSLLDKQKDKNGSIDFSFNFIPAPDQQMNLKFYHDRRKMQYHTTYDFFGRQEEDYTYLTKTTGAFWQYLVPIFNSSKLTLGADFHQDKLQATKIQASPETQFMQTTSWSPFSRSLGIWTVANIFLTSQWQAQLGLRLDDQTAYSTEISPNLGFIFHLNQKYSLKASWGKAFRAPTFNDLYWPQGGNQELKPEIGKTMEFSFSSQTERNFSQISFFHREVKNLISWAPLGKDGTWQPFNLNKYSGWGIELESKMIFSSKISMEFNYTGMWGKERNNELVYQDYFSGETKFQDQTRKARFTPENSFALKFLLNPISKIKSNLLAQWTDERINYYPDYDNYPEILNEEKAIPSHLNFDFSSEIKFFSSFSLIFSVFNLFDEKTPLQFGNQINDRDFPNPGRRIKTSLKFEI